MVEHKENSVRIAEERIQHLEEDETWFNNIITCDETWLYQYDPEMKQQSTQWVKKGTGPPKKTHAQKAGLEVMLIAFFHKKRNITFYNRTLMMNIFLFNNFFRKNYFQRKPQKTFLGAHLTIF